MLTMFLRSCSLALRSTNSVRAFSSSRSLRKDAAEETAAVDLDSWKTVMRSQVLREESEVQNRSALDDNRELVEMWHQAGKLVPKNITDDQLKELTQLTAKSAKKKYLKHLAIKELHKSNKKQKQEKKKSEREAEALQETANEGESEELKNTFLLRLFSSSVSQAQNWRVAQALRFGQPLVYDMSYEQHMNRRELENTIKQLIESEGCNRRAPDPFHLHFCGLQPDGGYLRELRRSYEAETWERLLITASEKTYLEMFPHEDLVYLTADSKQVLKEFDHSKVYIIGAMVDRSILPGVSLANAKRQRLATARLPLDELLQWECGAKNLTLDQMMRIMLTIKNTGSWEKALEFVPKRKHTGFTPFAKNRFARKDSFPRWSSEQKRLTTQTERAKPW